MANEIQQKFFKSRFIQKYDTEENWDKATSFYPLKGEIIIYIPDENYSYPRFKVGMWDGKEDTKTDDMKVMNLPFINGYTNEEIDALLKNLECETFTVRESDGDNIFSIAEGTRITGGSTNKDMIAEMVGSLGAYTVNLQEAKAHQDMSLAFGANSDTYGAGTVSFGVNTSAGTMAYYWDAITFGDKPTIQLSTTRRASTWSNPSYPSSVDWEKGDRVTIKTKDSNWVLAGTIESVSGNVVTLDAALPFTDIGYTSALTVFTYAMPHDRTIHNIDKPESGVISIGFGAIALGGGYENKTRAPGMLSLALGYETLAAGSMAVAAGQNTEAGYASLAIGAEAKALGATSLAVGTKTKATGLASIAGGQNTEAAGDGAVALGVGSKATGLASIAGGQNTEAAGDGAVALGVGSKATEWAAFAAGPTAQALGKASVALGYQTQATASTAFAEGRNTRATGEASHAEGNNSQATAMGSHAEGGGENLEVATKATAVYAHAEGYRTHASGTYSHTEGGLTEAVGGSSHAEGYKTHAGGAHSHTEGALTETIGSSSHAEGEGSIARGNKSHAEGANTTASGEASHAGGIGTKATAKAQTAIGKYNAIDDDALFIVGNGWGDADNQRSNVFVVKKDGTGYLDDKKVLVEGEGAAFGSDVTIQGSLTVKEVVIAPSEGLSFRLNSDEKSYSVAGIGTCTDEDLIIPAIYDGLPVTSIGDSAFRGCSNLASVTIPDSVTNISQYAFVECNNLVNIVIPDTVINIGEHAFNSCYSLTSIIIGDSVTSIGSYVFEDCNNLTIYCKAETQLEGWDIDWNPSDRPVVWDYIADFEGVNEALQEKASKEDLNTLQEGLINGSIQVGQANNAVEAEYAGTASQATATYADAKGNVIHTTYATKEEVSAQIGDISAILDNILSIQSSLIGGTK